MMIVRARRLLLRPPATLIRRLSAEAGGPPPPSPPPAPPAVALTHLDAATGLPSMVDVSAKAPSIRTAVASAAVTVGPAVYALLAAGRSGGGAWGTGGKGDALVVARLAGIAAAKRTAELIPLCHTVALAHVGVELSLEREGGGAEAAATPVERGGTSGSDAGAVVVSALDREQGTRGAVGDAAGGGGGSGGSGGGKVRIVSSATTTAAATTGVEMEALVAASVAALTVYDMCKAVERGMVVGEVRLEEKRGGKSGHYQRSRDEP